MNPSALGLRVASVIFGLMGLGQLIRIIVCADLQVGARRPSVPTGSTDRIAVSMSPATTTRSKFFSAVLAALM
jgi:hypothetical protein